MYSNPAPHYTAGNVLDSKPAPTTKLVTYCTVILRLTTQLVTYWTVNLHLTTQLVT